MLLSIETDFSLEPHVKGGSSCDLRLYESAPYHTRLVDSRTERREVGMAQARAVYVLVAIESPTMSNFFPLRNLKKASGFWETLRKHAVEQEAGGHRTAPTLLH